MSVKVMAIVWDNFEEGGSLLLGMLALADYANDDGLNIYPSVESFGKKIRCGPSQARRILHQLIEDGYLEVVSNLNGGKPGSSRHYRINIQRLTTSADASPRTDDSRTASTDARGTASIHARDGLHPCAQTASADASLTISKATISKATVKEPLPLGRTTVSDAGKAGASPRSDSGGKGVLP